MGLIKSAISSIGGTLHEQWEDYIKCDELNNETLMVKKTTKTGQISAKSRIQVNPGQCAIIMDSGQILDATAEEGIYTFDASTSPSLFAGQFGGMFKEMWERFKYNGVPAKEQAIYYINITEITDNKFGTPNPIPFQDWSHPIPNQMTGTVTPLRVEVKCHGKYTFKIADPMTFMREIASTASIYRKEEITEQMRSEVIAAFQNVANELGNSEHKVPVLEMPSATDEIETMMQEKEFDAAIRRRGINLVSFSVESVILDDESSKKIDNYELSSNSFMQQGTLTGAYANAVQDAAKNEGGAMNGFMGVGMMNMASGGMMGGVAQAPFNSQQNNSFQQMSDPFAKNNNSVNSGTNTTESNGRVCSNCGNEVTGKFCTNCGTKYEEVIQEEAKVKHCPNCGVEATGKFCTECGTQIGE